MKLRAITVGVNPGPPLQSQQIVAAGRFASGLRSEYEAAGLAVQTLRLATPPFPALLGGRTEAEVLTFVKDLEACCQENGIDYCSIGPVNPQRAEERSLFGLVPQLIGETCTIFTSAVLAETGRPVSRSTARAIGQTIQTIARTTADGFGNLRFAAVLNCGPHIPFFPAAFHHGPPAFCLALEAADIVAAAAQPGQGLDDFRAALVEELEHQVRPLQQLAQRQGAEFVFRGLDLSPAPGPSPEASIAYAIERLGLGRFGEPGTLAAAAQITAALKQTRLRTCGYCGLMLPVLEDVGLAERNTQGLLRLSSLLSYSAVCGTGLDTIPLAGEVSVGQLAAVLSDVAALGWKLAKPLSARLLPVPGKQVGETTRFDFAYFVNTRVMAVD